MIEALDCAAAEETPPRPRSRLAAEILATHFGMADSLPPVAHSTAEADRQAREEFDERLAELYAELKSYTAVGREVGLSPSRVSIRIARHRRSAMWGGKRS